MMFLYLLLRLIKSRNITLNNGHVGFAPKQVMYHAFLNERTRERIYKTGSIEVDVTVFSRKKIGITFFSRFRGSSASLFFKFENAN
jgi:hypothetical protein